MTPLVDNPSEAVGSHCYIPSSTRRSGLAALERCWVGGKDGGRAFEWE